MTASTFSFVRPVRMRSFGDCDAIALAVAPPIPPRETPVMRKTRPLMDKGKAVATLNALVV